MKSFSPIKRDSAPPSSLKYFIRLTAGIVIIAILGKRNVDYILTGTFQGTYE